MNKDTQATEIKLQLEMRMVCRFSNTQSLCIA